MKTNKTHSLFLTVISLIVVSLSCNLPGREGTANQAATGLVQNYQPDISAAAVPKYTLSAEQQTQLATQGYPDRFTILFFTDTLLDGQTIAIRQESWYYDGVGYEIVFRNGEKFTERAGQPVISPELGKTAYRPEDFTAGMSLDALLAISGENGYYREVLDNDLIENGSLVFLKGLSAGFRGDLSNMWKLYLWEFQATPPTIPMFREIELEPKPKKRTLHKSSVMFELKYLEVIREFAATQADFGNGDRFTFQRIYGGTRVRSWLWPRNAECFSNRFSLGKIGQSSQGMRE